VYPENSMHNLPTNIVVLITSLFFIACLSKEDTNKSEQFQKNIYEWSRPMAETFHAIQTKYFASVDPTPMITKGLSSILSSLDRHSAFIDQKAFQQMTQATQGEFCGIGVVIDAYKDPELPYLKIIDIIPTGPADTIGLRAEDLIIQINDKTLDGMTVEEATSCLKGERNTTVQLKIQRASSQELLTFTLKRDIVKEQNAIGYYLKEPNMYYLALSMFSENSVHQITELLKKSQSEKAQGLILDLRNNTGGLLSAAIDIASLFIPKGSLVISTKNRAEKVLEQYYTPRPPLFNHLLPIIILVNNYTASAAEILAGCLRYYSEKNMDSKKPSLMVFIAGTNTFGKGSVQEVIPLSNGSAIKLTTALYYLPSGESIQGVGVVPDFIIQQRPTLSKDQAWFTSHFGHEQALRNTIKQQENTVETEKEKDKKPLKPKTWQEKKEELIGTDYTVLSAIRLMQMFQLALKAYPEKMATRQAIINFLNTLYCTNDRIALSPVQV